MEVGEIGMDFIEQLKMQYGVNTPIIAGEIAIEGMNEETIRQNLSRQSRAGRLQKYSQGVYYIAEQTEIKITDRQVYEKKFITDGNQVYGYYSGKSFEYELGITNSAPEIVEIVTNKETSRGRELKIGGHKVYIKKGYVEITKENVNMLALLSYINNNDNITEIKTVIMEYMQKNHIQRDEILKWLVYYPSKTSKKCIELFM